MTTRREPETAQDFALYFARRAQIAFTRARLTLDRARAHGGAFRVELVQRARSQNRYGVSLLVAARRYFSHP